MNKNYDIIRETNRNNEELLHQKKVFYQKNKFYGFKKITEERRKEIEEKAQFWVSQNQELNPKQKLFYLYYQLNKKYTDLKIEPNDECYLFLILAFDPELKLLQISFEESRKEEIKRRFQEEFNTYYDSRLLQIELYYNRRFPTVVDEFDRKM